MSKDRLETLTDGVFAIVVTLLVLEISIPIIAPGPNAAASLSSALVDLWPDFWHYILSFYLLAITWTAHHTQLHFMAFSDRAALWIGSTYLMFVALVPFSTSLVSEYGELHVAVWLFDANVAAIGLASYAYWRHASTNNRLTKKTVGPYLTGAIRSQTLLMPLMAFISAGLALIVSPRMSMIPFLFIPFLHYKNYRIIDSIGPGDWESTK